MTYNQIVPLNTTLNTDGTYTVNGVFWLTSPFIVPVPLSRGRIGSRVSFVDQGTLLALRAGIIVEQPFSSQEFTVGTSLSVVQSFLQTQYQAAQTTLNNNVASFASGSNVLIGTEFNGTSWVPVSTTSVFDPVSTASAASLALAAGMIGGLNAGRAQGYVSTNATVNKAINATAYIAQGTNAQRSLKSTSVLDTGSGAGAQQVTITYLDASFALHTEVIVLNGTTAVNTVGVNYAYIESMVVTQVGVSQGTNQGAISIYTGTGGSGTVWGSIAINQGTALSGTGGATNGSPNITFSVAQTLPAGTTLYFSGQAGVPYVLLNAVSNATTGTLTSNFTGTTATGQTVNVGAGDNQTFWGYHYVPAGVTCYVQSMIGATTSAMQTLVLVRTGNPSLTNLPLIQFGPTIVCPTGDNREHDLDQPSDHWTRYDTNLFAPISCNGEHYVWWF